MMLRSKWRLEKKFGRVTLESRDGEYRLMWPGNSESFGNRQAALFAYCREHANELPYVPAN